MLMRVRARVCMWVGKKGEGVGRLQTKLRSIVMSNSDVLSHFSAASNAWFTLPHHKYEESGKGDESTVTHQHKAEIGREDSFSL